MSETPAGTTDSTGTPAQVDSTVETAPAPGGTGTAQEVGPVPVDPDERPATSDPAERDPDEPGLGAYGADGVGGGVG